MIRLVPFVLLIGGLIGLFLDIEMPQNRENANPIALLFIALTHLPIWASILCVVISGIWIWRILKE